MLDRGDQAVLVAPVANFYHELDRMHFETPRFHAVNSTNGFSQQTVDTEIPDLRAALKKAGKSDEETERIVASHLAERVKLQKYIEAAEPYYPDGSYQLTKPEELPTFPSVVAVEGLPDEFGDYFEGAIYWHNSTVDDKDLARQAWERILNRPASERHYKSTWAAFMLGRYWEDKDPQKSTDYFKQVCELASHGFSDPDGLAAASIGQEARLALRTNDFQTAIELYMEQYAVNGWGSGESLQVALGRTVRAGPEALAPLALKPQTRQLVTAYLISQRLYDESSRSEINADVKAWLEAVEKADVKDVELAEQFALAAYQADDMEVAQRWIVRAGNSPVAQWLQAKLFLRTGKIGPATIILSRLVDSFPLEESTNEPPSFAGSLFVKNEVENDGFTVAHYIRGELGALQLSRRDYVQSLDLLLRGDFWTDAAYIADHVLTTDELKSYVDDNWPALEPSGDDSTAERKIAEPTYDIRYEIRYLLARRLTRESRGTEARPYYPETCLPNFDEFMKVLTLGWDESLAPDERAKALASAAFIARTNGMELLATESAPDWHMTGGGYDEGVTLDSRTNDDPKIVFPSADELRRHAEHKTDPDKRYHYRYQAAALAWEAAKLMPNNSDETARLLCTAGSWIKAQDPVAADVFYKALVRRCRKTEIGAEADEIRWFPEFDEDGNVIRTRLELLDLPTPEEMNSEDTIARYPIPGKRFIVQPGDHIRYIASAVRRLGIPMTAKEIFAANPEITPNDNIEGREILIPYPGRRSATTDAPDDPMLTPQTLPTEELSPDPPSPDSLPVQTGGEYILQSGDTLAAIARRFDVSIIALEDANPGLDPRLVKVGQQILIPAQTP